MIWNIKMLAQLLTTLVFSASFTTTIYASEAVAMITDLTGKPSVPIALRKQYAQKMLLHPLGVSDLFF